MIRRPPRSTLYPCPTLFRSRHLRETEPTPKNAAHATPEEIADVLAFLASPAADPINGARVPLDRKSTRLSSHANISYAVFCLKKKTQQQCHLVSSFAAHRPS